jgi:hypothetical protein
MKAAACIILTALVFGVGCGGSATAPTPTTLAGTWTATRAEFANASNSAQRVEAIAGGAAITLTLQSGGTFTQQTTRPGEPAETMTGTWTSTQDVLTLHPTGVTFQVQFDMSLSGNTLTLNGGHVQFDVNGDNQDEEAILNMTLIRR